MSRCLKWVAVKDGEPILCEVKAIPRSIIFSLSGPSQCQKIQLFMANGTNKPQTPHSYPLKGLLRIYVYVHIGVRETLTGYFVPGRVGHGAWITWDLRRRRRCRRLVVNAHLGPIFRPKSQFSENFSLKFPTANPKLVFFVYFPPKN